MTAAGASSTFTSEKMEQAQELAQPRALVLGFEYKVIQR